MMDSIAQVSRRHFPRHQVALSAAILPIQGSLATSFECRITNLSRYGARVTVYPNPLEDEPFEVGTRATIRMQLAKMLVAEVGLKVLRREVCPEGLALSGQLSFPREPDRRRLTRFLASLDPASVVDRRLQSPRDVFGTSDSQKKCQRRKSGIFAECESFAKRVATWRDVYTFFRPTESVTPGRIVVGGRELISFGSKDYLGLANDPRVKKAAHEALDRYGTGSGSPVLNGTLHVHEALEAELAQFKAAEAAIFFAGGYLANIAVLTGILKPGDRVFLDEKAHASTFDGSLFGGASVVRFRHNSADDLKRRLEANGGERRLVIVDGVYSVEGDLGRISELLEVAKAFDTPLMVDDAHGLGVMGGRGAGTTEHFGLLGQVDLEVGTASTVLGGVGGFLIGPQKIVDYLRHFSRGFLFTTSLPAATAAGLLEALRIIREEPTRREKLWGNIRLLRGGLSALGYDVSSMEAAVVCLRVGHEEATYELVKALQARGIYVNSFVRPAVKRGQSIIRLSVSAAHTTEQMDYTVSAFRDLKPVFDRAKLRQGG